MTARSITIYRTSNGWDVHEGERSSGTLSWHELLGQIAALTMPRDRPNLQEGLFGMHTPEEREAQRLRQRRSWVPHDGKLGEFTANGLHEYARELGTRGGRFDELLPWHAQPDTRVRLAMMLLAADKEPDASVVDAEIRAHAPEIF